MTKNEALKHFKLNYADKFHAQKISDIQKYIKENQVTIENEIIEAFKNLFIDISNTDKEVAFITGCLLRTSIKNNGNKFLLSAYNSTWFLDKNPVETYYEAPWLWDKLHEYQKEIATEAKKYIGKITKVDIERIKWSKINDYKMLVLPIFRRAVEKFVKLQEYKTFQKAPSLSIRIGEYYDITENVWFENNIEMPIEKMKPLFKPQNEAHTTYKHYKNLDLSKGDYTNINFAYTRFENIDFSESIMKDCFLIGTKFLNCNLTNMVFENAVMCSDYKEDITINLSEKQKGEIIWV